ncbi:MAG: COX15/CtaA family protein [Elusimicrobia bacterium]|nr:COX15/CtaA family protein [Elusimicrobiota bacterium]
MSQPLRTYARLTACTAFFLLIAGGLVTSTGSSLSVPDWPLSFGTLLPPMIGGVLFEHGHRLLAGAVALMTFALTLWCYRAEPRIWVRRVAYFAAAAIVAQAALGGLTVLMRLPPAVSVAHACLAQLVFCALVAIAQAGTSWFTGRFKPVLSAGWRPGAAAFAVLYAQLVVGAVVRHTGRGAALHMAGAGIVAVALLNLLGRGLSVHREAPELAAPSALLGLLLPAQIGLGVLSYRAKFSPDFLFAFDRTALLTTAHLAVGALILATTVVWTLRAWRLGGDFRP